MDQSDLREEASQDSLVRADQNSAAPRRICHDVTINLVGGREILINPAKRHQITDSMDLVGLAQQLQTADNFTKANTTNKLIVIVDQIRYLQEQAKKILEEANRAQQLHHVACNFKKIPGNIYYLYEKIPSQERLFSMLSPSDWGRSCPYSFLGAFKLQYDMSWTPFEKIQEKEEDLQLINRIIQGSQDSSKMQDPFAFRITDVSHQTDHSAAH
ncbi:putative Uncharacterized protein C1orf50 [Hypsibius exemplaris]|uniref:Uncharacterized protein n=1 Tax=Hypsibius exemplaris TaxID=2072580 RepID=A0A9X6RK93_HYPEX|nr:putative Uncharacterized protein C1orf50 [Hypsibius exemplaris]